MVCFLSTVSFISITYFFYHIEKKEFTTKQKNIVKIKANAINSIFLQYEILLDILGFQILNSKDEKFIEKAKYATQSLLKYESSILGFSLASPDGKIFLLNTILNEKEDSYKNLLNDNQTKSSFIEALHCNKMIVGKSYFHEKLQKYIIPLRKAIKINNNVVAVISSAIDLNYTFRNILLTNSKFKQSFLFKQNNYFLEISEDKAFKKPIIKDEQKEFKEAILDKADLTLEQLKDKEKIITIENRENSSFSTIKYLKRFDLWIVIQSSKKELYTPILKTFIFMLIIVIAIQMLVYYLVRHIYKIEKSKQQHLYEKAIKDDLTGLFNRFYLTKKLEKNRPYSLLFLDIDNFKTLNDTFGHFYGDKILKIISIRLQRFIKEDDFIVRYSGDEFILITYNTNKEEIEILAKNILTDFSSINNIGKIKFTLSLSIGIVQYPINGRDQEEIKKYADIAMYEAKKIKNTFVFFENSLKDKYLRQSLIEQELRKAITNDEIYMMYQPQFDSNLNFHGVEALVRWENSKLGFVTPDEFIKIAENSGIMASLGNHIISKSLKDIKNIQDSLKKQFHLSINISMKQFIEKEFFNDLLHQIKKVKFKKEYITLEVTENVFIEDIEFIVNLLNRLKKQNLKISLDDFGTGYSSLSLLKKVPIDELKIDKSFIDDIINDVNSLNMAKSIITIGKQLNMSILAEGIETKEQKDLLDTLNCDLYQGYYYSKPLRKEQLKEFLKTTSS